MKTLLTIASIAMTVPALASGSPWVNQVVRADYGGKRVTGRIIQSMSCLYVRFDQAQPGGVQMARIADSIQGLHVKRGDRWVVQDLQAVRKGEAARCFADSNG